MLILLISIDIIGFIRITQTFSVKVLVYVVLIFQSLKPVFQSIYQNYSKIFLFLIVLQYLVLRY